MRNPTRLHHDHGAVCTMYKLLDQRSGAKPVRRGLGAEWATHGGDGLRRRCHNFCNKDDGVLGNSRRCTIIKESVWCEPRRQEVQSPSDWRMGVYWERLSAVCFSLSEYHYQPQIDMLIYNVKKYENKQFYNVSNEAKFIHILTFHSQTWTVILYKKL